jgi:hypothetical protein
MCREFIIHKYAHEMESGGWLYRKIVFHLSLVELGKGVGVFFPIQTTGTLVGQFSTQRQKHKIDF